MKIRIRIHSWDSFYLRPSASIGGCMGLDLLATGSKFHRVAVITAA